MPLGPANITLTPATLPSGFCPGTEQERLNEYARRLLGQLPGNYSTINYGNTKPSAIDQDKPWIRTNGDATFDRIYTYANGAWRSKHLIEPNFIMPYWYVGTLTAQIVAALDGGTYISPTPTSADNGPFWELASEMAAKFPIHPGTFASGVSMVGAGTGGSEKVTLAKSQIPPHQHEIPPYNLSGTSGATTQILVRNDLQDFGNNLVTSDGTDKGVGNSNPSAPAALPHDNIPPYVGLYFIRRTARLYYIVT